MTVTISGATAPDDGQGTVDFFYCFNASAVPTGGCATGGTAAGADIPLVDTSSPANNKDGVSGAFSSVLNAAGSALAAGYYCFRAEVNLTNYDDPAAHTNVTTECFQVQDTSSTATAQDWLPNDSATVTSTGGSALSGSVVFTLYTGSDCNAGNDDTQLYTETKTLTNAASPATVSTSNTAVKVTATGTSTVSWKAVYSGSAGVTGSNHCQTTSLTITN